MSQLDGRVPGSNMNATSSDLSNTRPAPAATASANAAAASQQGVQLLSCSWGSCKEKFVAAEKLYDHICDKHVGRKSTNNLNLICGWAGCHTKTVKRDHITSHIRVHVPLKPHKCEFCGKTFKRPQDLKKHVKTHADDPMMRGSQDHAAAMSQAYRTGAPRGPTAYYDHNGAVRTQASYTPAHPGGYQSYYAPQPGPHAQQQQGMFAYSSSLPTRGDFAFGQPVAHPVAHHPGPFAPALGSSAKRAIGEMANDVYSHAKRRHLDPHSYDTIRHFLAPLHTSFASSMPGYVQAPAHVAAPAPAVLGMSGSSGGLGGPPPTDPMHQHYYLPALRTKEDLSDFDLLLSKMQHTVYESGMPTSYPAIDLRHESPPAYASTRPMLDSYSAAQSASPVSVMSSTLSCDTPAFTPPSSSASSAAMSPASRHQPTPHVIYPALPATTPLQGHHDPHDQHYTGLGSSFSQNSRRFSGGMLQSASRPAGDTTSTATTSGASETAISSPSGDSDSSDPETYDDWVQNMRVIDGLRSWVRQQLDQGEFDAASSPKPRKSPVKVDLTLCPDRMQVDGPISPPEVKVEPESEDKAALYPSLPRLYQARPAAASRAGAGYPCLPKIH